MSNNAKVGGILSIVSGVLGLAWMMWWVFVGLSVRFAADYNNYDYGFPSYSPDTVEVLTVLMIVFVIFGLVIGAIGVLSIVGGAFATSRRRWGWALAGAIGSVITFFPLGIAAIVLIATGRHEFATETANISPPPPAPPVDIHPA